jgi:hypothetical protein
MVLWCILLLVTTHVAIVWLCLAVVLLHWAQKIFPSGKDSSLLGPLVKKGR